ncbi:MAG: histidine kinase [Sphingomonas sp.]|uniref:sensor histidine kinase n=1 Tax=Sphingomonas sp. TaxID=28214 RepID=UPI002276248C|nr:histidine kinase [Sphingomonas sp.]MCX8475645.1 histidine kinase [Sphingomonas sp.]
MRSPIPERFRRREFLIAALLTALLWAAALVLWSAQDLVSGVAFPFPYKRLLAETFGIGVFFSAALAAAIGISRRLPRPWMIAATVAAAIGIATLHGFIDAQLMRGFRAELHLRPAPLIELFYRGLMPFVLIYGLYAMALGLMLSEMTVRDSERRLAEARNAAQQAQLAALRFQLNPHFLFNTLNAISSLIVTRRNDEAERMTMKLSEFLRLSLEADPDAEVTLDEELTNTQSYLEIEAVRFSDRLQAEFDCPAELLNAYVPSFLLQPLVENSIKYAVAPSRRPVTLSVRASAAQGMLLLVVEDSGRQGPGIAPFAGTGVGLDNVRRRLAAFYGAQGSMAARASGQGFVVSLALPLRYARVEQAAE